MNFSRDPHINIHRFLKELDADLFTEMGCFFGGGTAVSLLNSEYRLSVDVDFLCASGDGYAMLRGLIFDDGIAALFKKKTAPKLIRDVRADQYGVRAVIDLNGSPLKFEIVKESRIEIESEPTNYQGKLPVPTLSENALFAEKLLANADRGLDKSVLSKDMLDLIVMQYHWGNIPTESVGRACKAYGQLVGKAYEKSFNLLSANPDYLNRCLTELAINDTYRRIIAAYVNDQNNAFVVSEAIQNLKSTPPSP